MKYVSFLISIVLIASCERVPSDKISNKDGVRQDSTLTVQLDKEVLYDKILGSLVGSAIGDAMGAPTEMWGRKNRQTEYGYINRLDAHNIEPSPEGIWERYLPPGATTDDTRWKVLIGEFIMNNSSSFNSPEGPDPRAYSNHILKAYQREVDGLKKTEGYDPDEIALKTRRMVWLQEWAGVSEAFLSGDIETYTAALHKFYGGDLLCAGMLYAPAVGFPFPGNPEKAYKAAYRLGIFDQGYARDITGLTAAMVAEAMNPAATQESILNVLKAVDPHHYFKSRLMGRSSFKTYQAALYMSEEVKSIDKVDPNEVSLKVPGKTLLETWRMQRLFDQLDSRNQDLPAHAQEILLITLTSMIYSDFGFKETMEFITNYGRDNDTSAAVAGAILGAYHGFAKLPVDLSDQVLKTNKENLGIDLEKLASELTESLSN